MDEFRKVFKMSDVDRAEEENHQKKRKIDSDGFVCPTTPDIPKTSHLRKTKDNSQYDDIYEGDYQQEEGPTVSGYFQSHSEDSKHSEILPTNQGAALQESSAAIPGNMQTLLAEFTTETSSFFESWSAAFSNSEVYESECPNKLDELIEKAKSLEQSLNKQKNSLCQRLKGIGQTLQLD
ncbi:uncharacterized protein LOC128234609 isoform X2 [Mya arenaria]|uniref:uncharacterized protein LOC128234609 isoform X2 n=1 Tax=Mya arenaria TaxID=6604 RepID=UPI0022E9756B|nr:uncharacterized protein LOC128234609 isoform X2 [Mya arenaria]